LDAINLISPFTNKTDDDLDEQLYVLTRHRIDNIELRGAWGWNMWDLPANQVR